jgi:hypothetical protein
LIQVDGCEFSVCRNLILALSHLRDPSQPKTFWIDAICIDQKNIEEKNHQVSLMKEIYGRAYSVIAWLGAEDNDSSRLLEFAAMITGQQNPDKRQRMVLQELERRTRLNESYRAFFERSYWYRTWIIQEIFSAKRLYIQCGPVVITWKSLEVLHKLLIDEYHGAKLPSGQVLESMDDLHPWIRGGAITRRQLELCINSGERFLDLSRVRKSSSKSLENEERRQLHRLLFENWDAVATDPLDKVFALLGLASDIDKYDLVVDYDLTVNEVFTTVVENYVRIYGNLAIILPRRFRAQPYYLPSWCPDWSSPATQRGSWEYAYPFEVAKYSRPYCATGRGVRAKVSFSRNRQFMKAWGWRLDTIQHRSNSRSIPPPAIEERPSFWELPVVRRFLSFLPWSQRPRRSILHRATAFDIWYAMHRRVLYSCFMVNTRRHRSERSGTMFERYCRKKHAEFFLVLLRATNHCVDDRQGKETSRAVKDWKKNGDIPEFLSPDLDEVMTTTLLRIVGGLGNIEINRNYACFFMTRTGFMGLGPRDMRDDDNVCILRGCDFPVILRWNGNNFRLLGACYVVGFMHGQFAGSEKGSTREEEFEIC